MTNVFSGLLRSSRFFAVYIVGVIGFTWFEGSAVARFSAQAGWSVSFWDVSLAISHSPYLFSYWIIPLAMWRVVSQVRRHARPEEIVRSGTRSDWAVKQGFISLRWALPVAIGSVVVPLIYSSSKPFAWQWSALSSDPVITEQYPMLLPILPGPAWGLVTGLMTLTGTLIGLTVLIAAVASSLNHDRLAGYVAAGIALWAGLAFRTPGQLSQYFSPATYALPYLAEEYIALGPGGGLSVLVAAATVVYLVARQRELRRKTERARSWTLLPHLVGAVVLAGLASLHDPAGSASVLIATALQGVGNESFAFLHLLAVILLAIAPGIVIFRSLVDALSGRRYAEMIRLGSPARWYGQRLASGSALVISYGTAQGLWMLILSVALGGSLPDARTGGLLTLWTLALVLQAMVYILMLVIGVALFRRVEGAVYALAVGVALALPLGAAGRLSPSGQASLLRFTDLSRPDAPISAMPVLVLAAWLVVLGVLASVLIHRTRGEIL